jgi:hypothetical protein
MISRQIGWSQESNLLYEIGKQMDILAKVLANSSKGSLEIYPDLASFPPTGVPSVIYLAEDTGYIYYWDGASYIQFGGGSYVPTSRQLTINGVTFDLSADRTWTINTGDDIIVVANYSALPAPNTVSGQFYWCSNPQGTAWLPGSVGGTYYNSGLYYSNGTTWEFLNVPYQATQSEVNAGIISDKFVTPNTLFNSTQWATKENPLTFSSPLSRTTNTISIPQATSSVSGYLSSTDWSTFNSKQGALTLTTTGTSGAATLVGNTLNIPQYSGGGGMAIGGSITSATAGSVLFAGTSGVLAQDNSNLFWDDLNDRLGIRTSSPNAALHVSGSTTAASAIARGVNFTPTLVAAANNDVLVALDVNPTFTNGAFTGVTNLAARFTGPSGVGSRGIVSINGQDAYGQVLMMQPKSSYTGLLYAGFKAFGDAGGAMGFGVNFLSNNPVNFGIFSEAGQAVALFNSTRNVLIQNGGTFTDSGERLQVTGTSKLAGATTITTTATQLTLDYPGQATTTFTVASNGVFTINPRGAGASGSLVYGGSSVQGWAVGGTDFRGVLTVQKSFTDAYALNTDPADPGRVFVMQNNSTTNAINQFSNITMQINATGSLSGGRILGDFRLVRKTSNQSDAFFMFSAFRQGATYKDYFKLDFDNSWLSGNLALGLQSDPTAVADISASSTTRASLRIRSGTAPTSPNDGDIWFDGTDIKMHIGGVTKTFTLV